MKQPQGIKVKGSLQFDKAEQIIALDFVLQMKEFLKLSLSKM